MWTRVSWAPCRFDCILGSEYLSLLSQGELDRVCPHPGNMRSAEWLMPMQQPCSQESLGHCCLIEPVQMSSNSSASC